jgi:hypothetical protein
MSQINSSVNQNIGPTETVNVSFSPVYKVCALSTQGLITTSGRLNVNTLSQVVAIIISDYSNRDEDWVITYEGVVVATVHVNSSVTYP